MVLWRKFLVDVHQCQFPLGKLDITEFEGAMHINLTVSDPNGCRSLKHTDEIQFDSCKERLSCELGRGLDISALVTFFVRKTKSCRFFSAYEVY